MKRLLAGVALALLIASPVGAAPIHHGTLWVDPVVVQVGDSFDVYGCDFDIALGNVMIGFTAGSWGSPLDADGCFVVPGIPALSGDSLEPGVYEVTAYQYVHGRWRETGQTAITVAP